MRLSKVPFFGLRVIEHRVVHSVFVFILFCDDRA